MGCSCKCGGKQEPWNETGFESSTLNQLLIELKSDIANAANALLGEGENEEFIAGVGYGRDIALTRIEKFRLDWKNNE